MMFNCLSILACLLFANTSFACDSAETGAYGECSINYDEFKSEAFKQDLRAARSSVNATSPRSAKEQEIINTISKFNNLNMNKQKTQDAVSKVENLKGYEFDSAKADRYKAAIRNGISKSKEEIVIDNLEDYRFDDAVANRVNAAIQE